MPWHLNSGLTRHQINSGCRDPAEYLKILDVNVVGPLRVTQALLPLLLKKDTRKVINISSTLGSISTHRWAFATCLVDQAASIITHERPCCLLSFHIGAVHPVTHPGFVPESCWSSISCGMLQLRCRTECIPGFTGLPQLQFDQAAPCTMLHD